MKCLILAAGYATRLYPLTENFPKPLLEVKGKAILDWLIEDIDKSGAVDEYIVVSNHRFAQHFEEWAEGHRQKTSDGNGENRRKTADGNGESGDRTADSKTKAVGKITVIDDGTSTNETRLGAVKDIRLTTEKCGIHEDLLVIAGDNLLDFSLTDFIAYAERKGTSCVMRYYEPSEEKLGKSGVVETDGDDLILRMEEKPAEPKSHWCCPPFYFYKAEDVPLVAKGIESGCGVDAPGSFTAWLSGQTAVHAYEMPGKRYDIGDLESYRLVQETYEGIRKSSSFSELSDNK